jgi:hypothetical protein
MELVVSAFQTQSKNLINELFNIMCMVQSINQSINLFHFHRSQMANPSQGCRTSQIIYIQIKFKLQKNT